MSKQLELFSGMFIGAVLVAVGGYWVRSLTSKNAPLPPYAEIDSKGSIERTEVFVTENAKVVFVVEMNLILVFEREPDSYSIAICGNRCLQINRDGSAFEISDAVSRIYFFDLEDVRYAQIPSNCAQEIWKRYKNDRSKDLVEAKQGVVQEIRQFGSNLNLSE